MLGLLFVSSCEVYQVPVPIINLWKGSSELMKLSRVVQFRFPPVVTLDQQEMILTGSLGRTVYI